MRKRRKRLRKLWKGWEAARRSPLDDDAMTAGNVRVGITAPVTVAGMTRIARAPGIEDVGIIDRPREKDVLTETGHRPGERDRIGIARLRGLDHLELVDIEIDTIVGVEHFTIRKYFAIN